ncbi:MAG: ATP-binding cassette domain-containing protein [Geobacter sp.]|nr:ATP-binding cassette domain-containing protein [Geobacter sp.]
MPLLYSLHDVTKVFGTSVVLDIDHLSIEEGTLYTLTGANGAGKSTLLAILAFLIPPSSGQIAFVGEPVRWTRSRLCRLRRNVTLLHQDPYLLDASVAGNVAFGLKVRGSRARSRRGIIEEALAAVGLSGHGERPARELSGGQKQRVALARAIAVKPRMLLLDEPFANMDRESAAILESVITALPAQGTSVLLTTHDPSHPDRLGNRNIHLVAGRLVP